MKIAAFGVLILVLFLVLSDSKTKKKGQAQMAKKLSYIVTPKASFKALPAHKRFKMFSKSHSEIENDSDSVKYNMDFDPNWEKELKAILIQQDPEQGQLIYSQYLEESSHYRETLRRGLEINLKDLSSLNGETFSTFDETRPVKKLNLKLLEYNHHQRLRQIFGDYEEYVSNQYELYKARSLNSYQ